MAPIESHVANVAVGPLARVALLVALATALANVGVWRIAGFFGRMTIGAGEVAIGSVIGALGAAVVLAVLSRRARDPKKIFVRIAIAVLAVYALGPISACIAPYMEGAEKFNLTTVLATEVMHLVSGISVLVAFTRSSVMPSRFAT